MTGCAVITDDVSIILVEGGHKAQKKYAHIVQNRIKWNDALEDEDDTNIDRCPSCHLNSTTFSCPSSLSLWAAL